MTENQTPQPEAVVIEFPKKSIVQKAKKVVIAVGMISAGTLIYFNYAAKRDAGELDLDSDEQELKIVEGETE